MGTSIVLVHGFTDGDLNGRVNNRFQQLWWKSLGFASGKVGSLRLARDGLTPAPLPLFPAITTVSPSGTLADYSPLSTLSASLIDAGNDVRFFSYDWRLPVQFVADQLKNVLKNVYVVDGRHFTVVAHSMGGLVSRFAYHLSTDAVKALWDKTVYLCSPHGGSYVATQSVEHPQSIFADPNSPFYQLFAVARQFFALNEAAAIVTRLFQSILSTFPALYEIMPNVVDFSPYPDPRALAVLNDLNNLHLANPFWSGERMTAAFATMTALNSLASEARAKDVCVVGTDFPTPGGFVAVDGVVDFDLYAKVDGDGVVTTPRQKLSGTRIIEIAGLQHSQAPRDPRVIRDMPTWIQGSDTVAVTIEQPTYFDPNNQLQGAAAPQLQTTWAPPNLAMPTKQDP